MEARRLRLVIAAAVLAAAALGLIVAGVVNHGGGGSRANAAAPAAGGAAMDPHPVARGFKPGGPPISQCRDAPCYEQAFGTLVYRDGPKAAFKVFDADIAKPGTTVQVDCHRIAHRMGAGALLRFHGDVAQAFS